MEAVRPGGAGKIPEGGSALVAAGSQVSQSLSTMAKGITAATLDKIGGVVEKDSPSLTQRAVDLGNSVKETAKKLFEGAKKFIGVDSKTKDKREVGDTEKKRTEESHSSQKKELPKKAEDKPVEEEDNLGGFDMDGNFRDAEKPIEEEEEFFDLQDEPEVGEEQPLPQDVKVEETGKKEIDSGKPDKVEVKGKETSSITDKIIGALKKAWDIFKTPKAQEIFKAAIIGTALLLGALALISLFAFPPAAAAFAIAAVAVAGVGLVTYNAINMFVTQPEKAIEEEKKQEIKDKKHIGKWDEKVSTLDQEIPKKTGELNQLNKEIETHKGELDGLKTELAGLEKGTPEFAAKEKQVTDKESQIKKEEADRNGLQIQIKNKEAELQLLQEKGKPEGEIGKLRKRHPEAFRDGLQAKNEIEGWKKDVEATRGEIGNLRGKKVSLENKIKTLQNDPAKVAEDPAKAADLEAAKKELAENDANLAKLQTQYDGLKSQKEDKEKLAGKRHLPFPETDFDIPTPNQPILQRDFSPERTALLLKSNQELIDKGGTAPQLREAIRQTEVNLREDSQNTDVNKELILQLDKLNERLQKPLPSLPPRSPPPDPGL